MAFFQTNKNFYAYCVLVINIALALLIINSMRVFTVDTSKIRHIRGHCYAAQFDLDKISSLFYFFNRNNSYSSRLKIFENGKLLPGYEGNTKWIADDGNGSFLYTNNTVYFSASDNTNPLENNRIYTFEVSVFPRIYILVAFLVTSLLLHRIYSKHGRTTLVLSIIFLSLFIYNKLPQYDGTYKIESDTGAYIGTNNLITHERPPAYRIFLAFFIDDNDIRCFWNLYKSGVKYFTKETEHLRFANQARQKQLESLPINDGFLKIVKYQYILQYISIFLLLSSLIISLSSPYGIFISILFICYAPLFDTRTLLSEALAQPLSFIAFALAILYQKFKKTWYVVLISLLCSLTFLTRPSCFTMVILAGCVFLQMLYMYRDTIKKILIPTCASLAFMMISVLYVVCISIYAGFFCPGLVYDKNAGKFVSYLANKSDIDKMPTEISKSILSAYIDHKREYAKQAGIHDFDEFEARIPHFRDFRQTSNAYMKILLRQAEKIKAASGNNSTLLIFSNYYIHEIFTVIRQTHSAQYWYLVQEGIKVSFDKPLSTLSAKTYVIAFFVIFLSIIIMRQNYFTELSLALNHILSIFATCVSIYPQARLVQFTDPFFILAVLISICTLCIFFEKKYLSGR